MKFLMTALLATLLASVGARGDIVADVIYGHKSGMALTYDVLKPDKPKGAGVVYMVSGGWFSIWREPEARLPQFKALLDAGFTVFAVHHGSAPRFKVPEAVADVRAAVRHIRRHAAEHGVDKARLGVLGGSAGGHLSLMLGLNPEGRPAVPEGGARLGAKYAVGNEADAKIAAVVAYFPPVDLRERAGPSERFPALDFPVTQAAAISPLLFVTQNDPPTLLIHGDKDELVPLRDSEVMAAALKEHKVRHQLIVIKGAPHGFRGAHREQAEAAMVQWFSQHL